MLQTCGYKHWRTLTSRLCACCRLADTSIGEYFSLHRPIACNGLISTWGKGADVLTLSELDDPLIDATLCPDQVLYVPAGFPHTTGTRLVYRNGLFLTLQFIFFTTYYTPSCFYLPGYIKQRYSGTVAEIPASRDASVHLTIGVDTLIWDLSFGALRRLRMTRAGVQDKLQTNKLPAIQYWRLQVRTTTID